MPLALGTELHAILVKHGSVRRVDKGACVVPAASYYPKPCLVVDGMLCKSFEVKNSSKAPR